MVATIFAHFEAELDREYFEIRNLPIAWVVAHFLRQLVCLRQVCMMLIVMPSIN